MAIDSRNKRASCLSLGLAIARVFANPDGSLANVNDRQHSAYLYSGIDVTESEEYGILCLTVEPTAVRSATITPAAVHSATIANEAVRSATITIEVCE